METAITTVVQIFIPLPTPTRFPTQDHSVSPEVHIYCME